MDMPGRRFGWILGVVLCAAWVAVPLTAGAAEQGDGKKDTAKQTQDAGKESDLVKAANAAKKNADAKTYTNDDLQEGKSPKVSYTNEDLTRMFGASETTSAGQTSRPSGSAAQPGSGGEEYDPLAAMEKGQQDRAARQKRIDEADSAVASAEARLKRLEVALLATVNPFSARPDVSQEEKAKRATSGESAMERNARVQKEVEEARVAVAEAEAALAQARAQ